MTLNPADESFAQRIRTQLGDDDIAPGVSRDISKNPVADLPGMLASCACRAMWKKSLRWFGWPLIGTFPLFLMAAAPGW